MQQAFSRWEATRKRAWGKGEPSVLCRLNRWCNRKSKNEGGFDRPQAGADPIAVREGLAFRLIKDLHEMTVAGCLDDRS